MRKDKRTGIQPDRVYVSDGQHSMNIDLSRAWIDETTALLWRVSKLLLAIDAANSPPDSCNGAIARYVLEMESATRFWRIQRGYYGH